MYKPQIVLNGYSSGNLLPLITILGLSYGGPFLHYTD